MQQVYISNRANAENKRASSAARAWLWCGTSQVNEFAPTNQYLFFTSIPKNYPRQKSWWSVQRKFEEQILRRGEAISNKVTRARAKGGGKKGKASVFCARVFSSGRDRASARTQRPSVIRTGGKRKYLR